MFQKPSQTVTIVFYLDDDKLVRMQTMVLGNDIISVSCWEGVEVIGVSHRKE